MYVLFLVLVVIFSGCKKEENKNSLPTLQLKQGIEYAANNGWYSYGSAMKIGIKASGDGFPITYIRITRDIGLTKTVELDKGVYIKSGELDTAFTFFRSNVTLEQWTIFILNENRDSAKITFIFNKAPGNSWSAINHFTGIKIGYPDNQQYPKYLSLTSGIAWSDNDVAGNESKVDLAAIYYVTSGTNSPTLTCPGYTGAIAYFPSFGSWTIKNQTTYDYKTSDNNLVSSTDFDSAQNDSLLISAYNPQYISGWCKFCTTGKIVPFKTASGKHGMVKVISADQTTSGFMELEIKVQK